MLKDIATGALGAGSGVAGTEAVSGNEAVGEKFATALSAVEELQNGEVAGTEFFPGQVHASTEDATVAPVTLAALPGAGVPPVAGDVPLAGGDAAVEPVDLKSAAPGGTNTPPAKGQDGAADVPASAPSSTPDSSPQGAAGDFASQPGSDLPPVNWQEAQSPKVVIPNVVGSKPASDKTQPSVAPVLEGEHASVPAGVRAPVPNVGAEIKPAPVETAAVTPSIVPSNDNAGLPNIISEPQALDVQERQRVAPAEQPPVTDRRWKTELPEAARSSLFKDAMVAGKQVDVFATLSSEIVADDDIGSVPVLRSALPSQAKLPDILATPLAPKAPLNGELSKQEQSNLPQANLQQDGASATPPPSVAEGMEDTELDLQISRPLPELVTANNGTQRQGGAAGARADSTMAAQLAPTPQLTPAQIFGRPSANNAVQRQDTDVPVPDLSDLDPLSEAPSVAKSPNPERKTGPAAAGAANISAAVSGAAPAAGASATAGFAAALVPAEPVAVESDAEPASMFDPKVSGLGSDVLRSVRQDALNMPTQAQSGQVATQVAAEISRNLQNGNTRFQMRFDPPELGRVEVNMRVAADGSVQAHLIVDRPETLDMFMRDQRGLERALEAAGLTTDSDNLKFTLKDQGGQNSQFSQEQRDESADGHASNAAGNDAEEETADQIVHLNIGSDGSGLDIRV